MADTPIPVAEDCPRCGGSTFDPRETASGPPISCTACLAHPGKAPAKTPQ